MLFRKALTMALFIKSRNIKLSAEIGVYRGRSLFPQAIAHKLFSGGTVYGIDPYDNGAAVQHDRKDISDILKEFADKTDFESIYRNVLTLLHQFSLDKNAAVIRKRSADATDFFTRDNQIGLIHIDGNHDTKFVVADVNDYFPLLRDGAVIILDDISWDSVKPAFDILNYRCSYIGEIINRNNDFAVFMKNVDSKNVKAAKSVLEYVKKYSS